MASTAKYTLGKYAILRIGAALADGAKPLAAAFKELCLVEKVTIGFEKQTVTFANFCTGGEEVEIPVGAKGILDFGDAQWVKDDPALIIMKAAADDDTEVWYEVLPEGAGPGKVIYDGKFAVKKWQLDIDSKGLITVSHEVSPLGKPEEGAQA